MSIHIYRCINNNISI